MGVAFYERAVDLQRRLAPPGTTVCNVIQTNGTVLDEWWGAFLKEHDFLVGVSLDGPREIHDAYRTDRAGRGTFYAVLRGVHRPHRDGWARMAHRECWRAPCLCATLRVSFVEGHHGHSLW